MFVDWDDLAREFEQEIEVDDINDFMKIVDTSVGSKIEEFREQLEKAKPEDFRTEYEYSDYQDYVSEMWNQKESTKTLAGELAIVAIYKRIEIHTVHLVKKYMHLPSGRKISSIIELGQIVPFPLNGVVGYHAFDELRLVNNSIKHEGKVSRLLATAFPNWVEGNDFGDLEGTYQRLLPGVKTYVKSLATQLQTLP